MKYSVRTSPAALNDVSQVLTWLASHSTEGAQRWYAAYLKALRQLELDADVWGRAPESTLLHHSKYARSFSRLDVAVLIDSYT